MCKCFTAFGMKICLIFQGGTQSRQTLTWLSWEEKRNKVGGRGTKSLFPTSVDSSCFVLWKIWLSQSLWLTWRSNYSSSSRIDEASFWRIRRSLRTCFSFRIRSNLLALLVSALLTAHLGQQVPSSWILYRQLSCLQCRLLQLTWPSLQVQVTHCTSP